MGQLGIIYSLKDRLITCFLQLLRLPQLLKGMPPSEDHIMGPCGLRHSQAIANSDKLTLLSGIF